MTDRARAVIDSLFDIGPVSSSRHYGIFFEVASVIEDGIPHWLAYGLPDGAEIQIEPFVDQAIGVVGDSVPAVSMLWSAPGAFEEFIAGEVFEVFGVLEFAGLIEWHGRVEVTDEFEHSYERGGWFRLTPLARHTTIEYIREAGYDFPTLANLALAEVEDVVNLSLTTTVEPADLLRQWRPGSSTAERAAAIAEFAMVAALPEQRLVAMDMLGELEPVGEVEPAVRQMLDSRCAGHATVFLLERGLATPEELGSFLDVGPLVDLLATVLDAPDALSELFSRSYALADDDLLEELWRHDQPETVEILDALGKHLPDKQLAKAARRAALKHRSWMANRQR